MNRVLPAIAIFIYMMFFTNASFARYTETALEVSFVNNTEYTCTINANLKHGKWDKKPPDSLRKHSSTYWYVLQHHSYGPDMTVKFTCGGYSFSARNQQNFCSLKGGKQKHATFDVDKHLTVTNKELQHASYHSRKPGIARITVSSKGRHLGVE
ncbi:hypothetical protein [Candidatus Sororendozoicomonas aggregata]|uniref:hypothetical protein n=1 Tax=Candidatus Sororendozoicomonas aggregata TaxID=3073239 RepID=UPI002ED15BD1